MNDLKQYNRIPTGSGLWDFTLEGSDAYDPAGGAVHMTAGALTNEP